MNRVTVFGLGRVGLPVAAAAVEAGFETSGVDVSPKLVRTINSGTVPRDDQTLDAGTVGEIEATTDPADVVPGTDVVLVCVPTPLDSNFTTDLSNVKAVFDVLSDTISPDTLAVIESTIPPGTTETIGRQTLADGGVPVDDVMFAHCPERIDPGNERWRLKSIPRVLGGLDDRATDRAYAFYDRLVDTDVYRVSNAKTAACTKIVENAFRDINIAFVNELAQFLVDSGVDVYEVLDGAATKPYGYMKFTPGPGVGGHCIPVDPYMLINRAKRDGYDHEILRLARSINDGMPSFVVNQFQNALNELGYAIKGTRITQLGISFKGGIGDVRSSPATITGQRLGELGANVERYDPYLPGESSVDTPYVEADAIIILTDHPEFDHLNCERLAENGVELVYDARNVMDRKAVTSTGITYGNLMGISEPQ